MTRSLIFVPALGSLFLLSICLVKLQCDDFCFIIFFFVIFGSYFLEACSFQMRDGKGVDLDRSGGKVGGSRSSRGRRNCTQYIMYKKRNYFR